MMRGRHYLLFLQLFGLFPSRLLSLGLELHAREGSAAVLESRHHPFLPRINQTSYLLLLLTRKLASPTPSSGP
jgi:hypothetical protein